MTIRRSTLVEKLAERFIGSFLVLWVGFWLFVGVAIVHFVLKLW